MLSAFTARPIVDLKSRDKSKIESVLAHGDRVFVGLNTGALRIYRVNETSPGHGEQQEDSGPPKREVELLREEDKFAKKGVQQLAIIKEASVLIALSESYVSFYELDTYGLSERLQQTRGATCFATSRSIDREADSGIASIVSRLAVAVKRKILLWTWQDSELSGPPDELTLPATVKSIIWITSTRIVAGMDPGFSLVDLKSQTVSEINRATNAGEPGGPEGTRFGAINASGMGYMGMGGWVPKPLAAKLGEENTLLVKDINSLFIDSDGQAKEKRQIPWTTAPDSIGYSYPYLLALQPQAKGMLEIRNPDTLSLLQTVPLANASILHVPQPNISLAHAGKGFLVASDRSIWRMGATGYGSQLDDLLAQYRYDEALSLANLIEDTLLLDKQARMQNVKIEKAIWLFDKREYRQAMELFSEAPARPNQVVSMYPEVIAGDLSRFKDAPQRQDSSEADESSSPQSSTPSKTKAAAATPKKTKGHVRGKDSDAASIRSSADAERQSSVEDAKPLGGSSTSQNETCC